MRAAIVESFASGPTLGTFPEPEAKPGELVLRVRAAALSNLVKAQAAGKHYSSGKAFPFVPGNDGVGVRADGQRVYFFGPRMPWGSMAEQTVVAESHTIPVPDAVDDASAAALGNPGLASWGALIGRARLQPGERVLVNGATGVAGQQAVQVAKILGASHVVATGRNPKVLESLRALGADEVISLDGDDAALKAAFQSAMGQGVNVVLDYVWGRSALLLLESAAGHGAPEGEPRVRFVQIGSISGEVLPLPAHLLRSSGVELLGSGLGSLSAAAMKESLQVMFQKAGPAGLKIETESVPLADVAARWPTTEAGRRLVFTL